MVLLPVQCPKCQSIDIVKYGKTSKGKQRFYCKNKECSCHTFILKPAYRGWLPEVKQQIVEMNLKGKSIRDIARILGISTTTVSNELKNFYRCQSIGNDTEMYVNSDIAPLSTKLEKPG